MASEFIARKTATYRVVCTSPDVCKVPKNTPVPFPIQEMLSSSTKTSTKTFANGCEIFTYESYTTKVTGDQPGVKKGIKSGTVGEVARPVEYSYSVYVEGVRIVRVNDACEMNEGNTMGKVVYAPPPKADKITDEGKIDSTKDEYIKGMCIQLKLSDEACAKMQTSDYWADKYDEYKQKAENLYDQTAEYYKTHTSDEIVSDINSAINDGKEAVTTLANDTIDYYKNTPNEQIVADAKEAAGVVVDVGVDLAKDAWGWMKDTYNNVAHADSVAQAAGSLTIAAAEVLDPKKKGDILGDVVDKGKDKIKDKVKKKTKSKDGGSVKGRPRKKIKCFCAQNSPGYKRCKGNPTCEKKYLKDYQKQLKDQEDAINSMSAEEFQRARADFENYGRNPAAAGEQARLGNRFKEDISENIKESILNKNPDIDFDVAESMANEKAATIRGMLAALHNPDNKAGGFHSPTPTKMGLASINSSIGASWSDQRINEMDWHAYMGNKDEPMNIELNVCKKKDCSE